MEEIRSIDAVHRHAREAADKFHRDHQRPMPLGAPDSEIRKAWAAAYYARGIELGCKQAQVLVA